MARFIILVLSRAFGDASNRQGDGARHIHFSAHVVVSPAKLRGKKVDGDMLIDNRNDANPSGEAKTVAGFIRKYTDPGLGRVGALDIVTGYFTIAGLDLLYRELSPGNKYRLVLSELAGDDDFLSRVIDLLQGDSGIEASLKLSTAAKNAIAFLRRETTGKYRIDLQSSRKGICLRVVVRE